MSRLTSIKPKVATLKQCKVAPSATASIGGRPWARIRARIMRRDKFLCQACLPDRVSNAHEVDHIIPRHMGGGDNEENLQALCRACHAVKSDAEEVARRGM
jgi:5-methylcytosine-specific restriction enzyme A